MADRVIVSDPANDDVDAAAGYIAVALEAKGSPQAYLAHLR